MSRSVCEGMSDGWIELSMKDGYMVMNVYVNNAEEYLAVVLSLCGEVDVEMDLPRPPLSDRTMRMAVSSSKKKRIIKKHSYEDGRTFIRFSSVGSADYLREISPVVYAQAQSIVAPDLKYHGDKKTRLRERCNYELHASLLDGDVPVNGINVIYRPNHFNRAGHYDRTEGVCPVFGAEMGLAPPEVIAGRHTSPSPVFYTKKVIKKKVGGEIVKEGGRGSRAAGLLAAGYQAYMLYPFYDIETSAWKMESELDAANYICGCFETRSPLFTERNIRISPRSLFLFGSPDEAVKLLYREDDARLRIDPCRIYSSSLVLPSFRIPGGLLSLISVPDWQTRSIGLLFEGAKPGRTADGILEDGTEIYNFIGCDLNRIRYASARIAGAGRNTILLVQEWAQEPVQRLFSRDGIEIVPVGDNDIGVLADALKQ